MSKVAVHDNRITTVETDQTWMKRSVSAIHIEQARVKTTIKHAFILGQILAVTVGTLLSTVLAWWLRR